MEKNEVIEKVGAVDNSELLSEGQIEEIVIFDKEFVKSAKFEEVKSRYGKRYPYYVTLFNGVKVEFVDDSGFYDLLIAYSNCGEKNYVKTKKLVEEAKINEEGNAERTFICIKYELSDGTIVRLFPRQYNSNKVIKKYYDFYNQERSKKNK